MIFGAYGTVFCSRDPRRGLTFFASSKKVSKERRPDICTDFVGLILRGFKAIPDERGTNYFKLCI